MRARDLAQPYVTVSQDTSAVEALRALVEHGLPGLLVVDSGGRPYAALPACEAGRALLPGYVRRRPGAGA
jgi:CBS domain-containing protein